MWQGAAMSLRVIGAGLPRTGTTSLKEALERLTGEPCYHMFEVFPRAEQHLPLWHRALAGDTDAFAEIFDGFGAAIDWPASIFWRELTELYPDAVVVLTLRDDVEQWWGSASRTVWEAMQRRTGIDEWDSMVDGLRSRLHEDPFDVEGTKAAYLRWNEDVRTSVDPARLVEMTPGDGWGPICSVLGIPVPDDPYPHANTTAEFRAQTGWE